MNISVDIQYMWRRVTVFNIQSSGGGFCQGASVKCYLWGSFLVPWAFLCQPPIWWKNGWLFKMGVHGSLEEKRTKQWISCKCTNSKDLGWKTQELTLVSFNFVKKVTKTNVTYQGKKWQSCKVAIYPECIRYFEME